MNTKAKTNNILDDHDNINANVVSNYLSKNPDFFVSRQDLLLQMVLPEKKDDKAVSLGFYTQIVKTAEANDELFESTRSLILDIIGVRTAKETVTCLKNGLCKYFAVDAVGIMFFSAPSLGLDGVQFKSRKECKAKAPLFSDLDKMFSNRLRSVEAEFLFVDKSISSAAVLPFKINEFAGILGVGSKNPEHFNSAQEDLFIRFITQAFTKKMKSVMVAKSA